MVEKSSGRTALHFSVESKSLEAAAYLASNPDINLDVQDKKGRQTPLFMAVKSGQVEIARFIHLFHFSNLNLFNNILIDFHIFENVKLVFI